MQLLQTFCKSAHTINNHNNSRITNAIHLITESRTHLLCEPFSRSVRSSYFYLNNITALCCRRTTISGRQLLLKWIPSAWDLAKIVCKWFAKIVHIFLQICHVDNLLKENEFSVLKPINLKNFQLVIITYTIKKDYYNTLFLCNSLYKAMRATKITTTAFCSIEKDFFLFSCLLFLHVSTIISLQGQSMSQKKFVALYNNVDKTNYCENLHYDMPTTFM